MYKVVIQSINQYNEVEWEEIIKSDASLRGAMNKATRWLNKENFDDLVIEKCAPLTQWSKQVTWRLV